MKTNKILNTAVFILIIGFLLSASANEQIFFDDFESPQNWTVNPEGTDDAATGMWERGDPEETCYGYLSQNGTTISGTQCLITSRLGGAYPGEFDIDSGVTSIRSPNINIPVGDENIVLSFSYYFAHYYNATSSDYLRVKVVGTTTQTVFEELGSPDIDEAVWETFSVSLNNFSGQTIYILIEAADNGAPSLVEAGIEDVLIEKESFVPPGIHDSNWVLVGDDIENTNSGAVKIKKELIIGDDTTNEYSKFTPNSFEVNSGAGTVVKFVEGGLSFHSGESQTVISPDHIETSTISINTISATGGGELQLYGDTQIDGELWARKVTVTLDAFPDFVFTPTYPLKSLEKTEEYIAKHGRLPGMPSEKEVKENGLDIGAMQSKLLEKIEEITLHLVSLDKQNKELKAEIKTLKQQVEQK